MRPAIIVGILVVLGIAGVGLAMVYLSPSEPVPATSSQPRFNTDPIPDTPSQGALHQGESTKSVTIDDPTGLLGMEAEGGLGVTPDSGLGSEGQLYNLGENGLTVETTVEPAGFNFDPYDIGCVNQALGMRAAGHPSYWTWAMIFPDNLAEAYGFDAGGVREPTADELTKMEPCIQECTAAEIENSPFKNPRNC